MNIRGVNIDDIDEIYNLQISCFSSDTDRWNKNIYRKYIKNSIVIEIDNKIVSVLIQGYINTAIYNSDFLPVNELGYKFLDERELSTFGIVLIFTDHKYRKRGLAEILINKHFEINRNKILCLNTRISNLNSIRLYKKLGYEHIANISKYYQYPVEDSIFMIKRI